MKIVFQVKLEKQDMKYESLKKCFITFLEPLETRKGVPPVV